MTNEEAIKLLDDITSYCDFTDEYGDMIDNTPYYEALDLAIKALEQCEVWNGSHGQIVAPKGTFERIYNDCKDEQQPNYLKKRDGNYVHYNVEWLLKNWQMELDILSDGKIKPCEDCISREAVMKCFKKWQPYMATRLLDYEQELKELPSVTPTSDAEDKYDIGYNCGYADAMSDIAESEE